MAEARNYHCDRCGKTISEHRTKLMPEVGLLRVRFPAGFDLCGDCSEQFVNWLKDTLKEQLLDKKSPTETDVEIPTGPVTKLARRDSKG